MTKTEIEKLLKPFDGILVIGDTHGEFGSFNAAVKFAEENNLFFISLGDLVDPGLNPYEVIICMYRLVEQDRAGFVIGNHDDKFYRHALGNKVKFSRDAKKTIEAVGESRISSFLDTYVRLIEHRNSDLFFSIGDYYLAHGAGHPAMWDSTQAGNKEARSRYLYGETTGEIDYDGYPVRIYKWIDEVPAGKTVLVGHDKKAIHNVLLEKPIEVANSNGGSAIFIDTGCGKGGFLTGAIMKDFKIVDYVEFK